MRIKGDFFQKTALVLCICLLAIPAMTFATTTIQHDFEIIVTLSSEIAVIGEEITANYEITGGSGEYSRISGVWNIHDSRTNCSYQFDGNTGQGASGSSTFIPKFGDRIDFQISGQDSEGMPFLVSTEVVEINGEVNYPQVHIEILSDTATIGEEITASFEVTGGSGTYSRIYGVWEVFDDKTQCCYQFGGKQSEEPAGTQSYIPKFGNKLNFLLEGQDSDGIPFLANSDEISITGEVNYPNVTIQLFSDSATIGEEITAEFEVTGGSGIYTELHGVWTVYDSLTNCSYQLGRVNFDQASGKSTFIPTYGDKIDFQIEGKDSDGIPIFAHTDVIPIKAANPAVIRIPESTRSIGPEAFKGIKAKTVYVPKTVTGIADDAFDSDVTLVFEDDTLAGWAETVGMKYRVEPGRFR